MQFNRRRGVVAGIAALISATLLGLLGCRDRYVAGACIRFPPSAEPPAEDTWTPRGAASRNEQIANASLVLNGFSCDKGFEIRGDGTIADKVQGIKFNLLPGSDVFLVQANASSDAEASAKVDGIIAVLESIGATRLSVTAAPEQLD